MALVLAKASAEFLAVCAHPHTHSTDSVIESIIDLATQLLTWQLLTQKLLRWWVIIEAIIASIVLLCTIKTCKQGSRVRVADPLAIALVPVTGAQRTLKVCLYHVMVFAKGTQCLHVVTLGLSRRAAVGAQLGQLTSHARGFARRVARGPRRPREWFQLGSLWCCAWRKL